MHDEPGLEARAGSITAWISSPTEKDIGKFLSCFTEDAVDEDVTTGRVLRGHTELAEEFSSWVGAVPDFVKKERSRLVSGDRASVEWAVSGTLRRAHGKLDFPQAMGRSFAYSGAAVLEFASDGRIRLVRTYWDLTRLLSQLGLLSPDAVGRTTA
ncbi:nuclear transport factor 2 family protein [Streptomyces sp. NPDC026206]|uniref:nuclear transport factor 2 family protein n=1 Tax=Streptomyces sp. NPDC026206 TaxID=3157089 RepID=UPI0033EFB063